MSVRLQKQMCFQFLSLDFAANYVGKKIDVKNRKPDILLRDSSSEGLRASEQASEREKEREVG